MAIVEKVPTVASVCYKKRKRGSMDSALWFGGDSTPGTFRYTITILITNTEGKR